VIGSSVERLSSENEQEKVLVTRSDFPKTGINLLQEKYELIFNPTSKTCEKDHLLQYIKGVDGLFCMSTDEINKDVLDAAGPQLKVIATLSLGFDHIDIEECKKRNIIVCNAVNPISVSCVAEFTIGLLLAVSRRIVEASGAIQRGEWVVPWYPDWYIGRGLTNATVGIVGMGRIVEKKGAHFTTLNLLKISDYANSDLQYDREENKGMFDEKAFSLMKSNAVLSTQRWSRKARSVDRCLKEQTNQSCWNRCDVSRTSAERPRAFNVPKSWNIIVCNAVNPISVSCVAEFTIGLLLAVSRRIVEASGAIQRGEWVVPWYPDWYIGRGLTNATVGIVGMGRIVVTPHVAAAEEIAMVKLSSLTAENIIAVLEGQKPLTPVF
ncbi:glyoxylate reductase, partial [Trichonephila inaurata madagascariensis]